MRRPRIDELGMCGVLAGAQDPSVRLLVTDDRAYDVLAALLPDARAGMISVLGAAARCAELVARHLGSASDVVTPMVCRDLHAVPAVSLPSELMFRPVQRLADDEARRRGPHRRSRCRHVCGADHRGSTSGVR